MQRRQKTRADLFFPVLLHAEGSNRVFEFCGTNFSSGGLYLLMKNPPAVGSELQLEFDLSPLGGRLEVNAKVVRTVTGDTEPDVGKWGAGLQFLDLGDEDQLVVQEWVMKVAPTKPGYGPGERPSFLDEPEGGARVEVRIRMEGFNYLTKHHHVKMTAAGLFIGTQAPLPTGARVDLELQPMDGTKVYRAKGQVMAIQTPKPGGGDEKTPGMSIRVVGADDETRQFLQSLREETA